MTTMSGALATGTTTSSIARISARVRKRSSSPGPPSITSAGIRERSCTMGSTRVFSAKPAGSETRGSNPAAASATMRSVTVRSPRATVTSTSALKRAAPCRIAAWAPNRYQRALMAANARPRSARTSASVDREERTRGAVDRALEVEVMGQVVPALRVRRPVRTDTAHVLPQQLGRLEGRARAALHEFPSPVLPLQHRQLLTRPLYEVTGTRRVHAVSLPWMTTAGTIHLQQFRRYSPADDGAIKH